MPSEVMRTFLINWGVFTGEKKKHKWIFCGWYVIALVSFMFVFCNTTVYIVIFLYGRSLAMSFSFVFDRNLTLTFCTCFCSKLPSVPLSLWRCFVCLPVSYSLDSSSHELHNQVCLQCNFSVALMHGACSHLGKQGFRNQPFDQHMPDKQARPHCCAHTRKHTVLIGTPSQS